MLNGNRIYSKPNKKNEKIFQLSNYKKQNKKKLEALQFSQKTTLNSRF